MYYIHLQEFTIYYKRKKEEQQSRYVNGERQYGRLFASVYWNSTHEKNSLIITRLDLAIALS